MRIGSQKKEPSLEMNDKPLGSNATKEIWLRELIVGTRWTKAVWHRACIKDEWEEGPTLDSCEPSNDPAIFSRKTGGNE